MREGLNANDSVVFDTSGSVNYYLKQAQQNEARRQAEQKALQEEMGKVKIDGVRQGDVPEYTSKYNEWKNLYGQIQAEKDLQKKAMLKRQFDEKELDLQNMVYDSKNLAKGETALNALFMDPAKRDNFTDDAVTKYQQSKNLSRNDPKYIRDLTTFERKIDVNKVLSELDKDDELVLKSSKWNNPLEVPHKQGNKSGVLVTQERVIDPVMQAQRYSAKWDADTDFKLAAKQLYPDLAASITDPVQLKNTLISQLVKDRVKKEPAKPVFKENDDWRERANYSDMLQRARKNDKGAADEATLYRQKTVNDMLSGVAGSGERFKAIVSAMPGYDQNAVKNMIGSKGNFIEVRVPKKVTESYDAEGKVKMKETPAYTVTIDKRSPEGKLKLNRLLSDITGENVSESKFQTGNAAGKVKGAIQTERDRVNKQKTVKPKNDPLGLF